MIQMIAMALGLSMDACAVSISTGMCESQVKVKDKLKLTLSFGLFQGIMPLIGYYLAFSFKQQITTYDHWIAFGLLSFLGVSMIRSSFEEADSCEVNAFSNRNIITKALATSIDALAIGITLATLNENIWAYSIIIGIITFMLSYIAFDIGTKIGNVLSKYALISGGLILIFIGVKILFEHM